MNESIRLLPVILERLVIRFEFVFGLVVFFSSSPESRHHHLKHYTPFAAPSRYNRSDIGKPAWRAQIDFAFVSIHEAPFEWLSSSAAADLSELSRPM